MVLVLMLQFGLLHASGVVGSWRDVCPSGAGNDRLVVDSNLVPMSRLPSLVRCKFVLNIHFCSHAPPSSDPTTELTSFGLWKQFRKLALLSLFRVSIDIILYATN